MQVAGRKRMPTLNEPGSALFADLDQLNEEEIHDLIGKLRTTRLTDIERTKKAVVRKAIESRPKPKKEDKTKQIKNLLMQVGFDQKILDLMTPKQLITLAQNVAERSTKK